MTYSVSFSYWTPSQIHQSTIDRVEAMRFGSEQLAMSYVDALLSALDTEAVYYVSRVESLGTM